VWLQKIFLMVNFGLEILLSLLEKYNALLLLYIINKSSIAYNFFQLKLPCIISLVIIGCKP